MCSPDLLLVFIAIIFPPVAVWVKSGICSADSIINIALCMLGFLPGLLHAWYIISIHPFDEPERPHDAESGRDPRVRYSRTQSQQPQRQGIHYGQHHPPPADNYGSFGVTPRDQPYGHPQQQHYGPPQGQNGGSSRAPQQGGPGEPPSYADVLKDQLKDHKIQH
ncbi:hypothetical protein BZA77DRAFT_321768 [Pyronema omphalodes]|nr:hypothetical protein BZA77DRAFT_321768 [Pyronema omphalodes]